MERWKSKMGLNRAKGLCSPTVCQDETEVLGTAGRVGREWTGSQWLGRQGGTNTFCYQVVGAKILLSLLALNPS